MKREHFLALFFLLAALLLALAYCSRANIGGEATATPTFPVSATPSDTPEPATATSTMVAPVTLTATATGTAVHTPPPTAVSPSPTSTPTPTPTAPPAPTERPAVWLVQPGDNLSDISEVLCGVEQWPWLFEENRDIIRNPDFIFAGQELSIPWPC
jgi:nucleoid-associated protein YgaU